MTFHSKPHTIGPMDELDAMIAWENGELDEEGTIALFQVLVNNGLAWRLQGCYGRMAQALINGGYIVRP